MDQGIDQGTKIGCGILFAIVLVLIGGCIFEVSKPREKKQITIKDVDRVVMHETYRYSFLVNGKFQTHTVTTPGGEKNIEFVYDVPQGQKLWVEASYRDQFLGPWECYYLVIHVHSPKDIEGGGWNHGKFGSGQNVVIE